ncbi:hypothetical protein Gotur_007752, partial [Gossypium turneri]
MRLTGITAGRTRLKAGAEKAMAVVNAGDRGSGRQRGRRTGNGCRRAAALDRTEERMGIRMVFYFILQLPWLIQSASPFEAGEAGCKETCENVSIPYPFGIKRGCYHNSWFRVTCNKTINGTKPFISRINMELLPSYWPVEDNRVTVNNPMTYLNCDDKGNNGTTSSSSVNLQGSPFFLSEQNIFGS